jgi:hypothetical protein
MTNITEIGNKKTHGNTCTQTGVSNGVRLKPRFGLPNLIIAVVRHPDCHIGRHLANTVRHFRNRTASAAFNIS